MHSQYPRKEKSSSSNQERFFDRLTRTETYASSKMKEKVKRPNESGRPLYNIELDTKPDYPVIKQSHSNSTAKTSSSSLSYKSGRSVGSTSISNSRSRGSGSIFDRLASTGTKSSICKDKKSATYVGGEKTFAESVKNAHFRDYGKGSTLVLTRS
jgi:hypothetical protein